MLEPRRERDRERERERERERRRARLSFEEELTSNNPNLWELLHTLDHILSNSSTWILFKAAAPPVPSPRKEREGDEGHGSTSEGERRQMRSMSLPAFLR
ncbi:unnamed protein product [Pleuronectes platessa]|uniref:Uncharacterized protein n=1 Tax=Pleuronectes platessa TaxID=8262 RepID=A0A9N7VV38_PLEPL|nr:unnamed protein product [Pleuronectes platessa]